MAPTSPSTQLTSASTWDEASLQQHPHLPSSSHHDVMSLEESAEQVSQLFATTITSLATDVHALKHLTTWKEILDDHQQHDAEDDEDETAKREEFLESLCDLDDVVTAVEKKVGVLRQIVAEEQRALENLNMLHTDSLDQNENLRYLVERCRNMKIASTPTNTTNDVVDDDDENNPHHHHHKGGSSRSSSKSLTTSSTKGKQYPKASSHGKSLGSSSNNGNMRVPFSSCNNSITSNGSSHSRHQEHHAHVQGLACYFDPVTIEELESVPRTTRGRVQLAVIQEALTNIEKCFHKKAVKERRQAKLLLEARQVALARYQGTEEDIDEDELIHNLVVTEQELRQSCTFFAAGEGTARTVLAVLKALRRIKQVPAKQRGLFCYKLCLD